MRACENRGYEKSADLVRDKKGSTRLRQHIDAPGPEFRPAAEQFRAKGADGRNAVCLGAEDDDGERQRFGFVLVWEVLIHRQKHVPLSGIRDELEQPAVFDAGPTRLRNGLSFMARQFTAETRGDTFIKEDSHLGGDPHAFARFFEKGDGLFAGHGGEILQKII